MTIVRAKKLPKPDLIPVSLQGHLRGHITKLFVWFQFGSCKLSSLLTIVNFDCEPAYITTPS